MTNKLTAVEWFMQQIPFEWSSSRAAFEAFTQAKQMEKEHIIDFASKVLNRAECSFTGIVHINEPLEDIYNETYSK